MTLNENETESLIRDLLQFKDDVAQETSVYVKHLNMLLSAIDSKVSAIVDKRGGSA
jgi:hypothetical protein